MSINSLKLNLSGTVSIPDPFHEELEFIKNTILENHPGVYNELDPNFSSQVYTSFKVAKEALHQAHSVEEKIQVLTTFGKSFDDAHLWVHYDSANDSTSAEQDESLSETRNFSIQSSEGGSMNNYADILSFLQKELSINSSFSRSPHSFSRKSSL